MSAGLCSTDWSLPCSITKSLERIDSHTYEMPPQPQRRLGAQLVSPHDFFLSLADKQVDWLTAFQLWWPADTLCFHLRHLSIPPRWIVNASALYRPTPFPLATSEFLIILWCVSVLPFSSEGCVIKGYASCSGSKIEKLISVVNQFLIIIWWAYSHTDDLTRNMTWMHQCPCRVSC